MSKFFLINTFIAFLIIWKVEIAAAQYQLPNPAPNKKDSIGLKQGFWKFGMPYHRGNNSMVLCEGFYYNNKHIGVWKKLSRYGKLLEMEVYYDTIELKAERIIYNNDNNIVIARGSISSRPFNDSITVYDEFDTEKSVFITSVIMRHGHWTYYDDNGKLYCEGEFADDKRVGVWRYYNKDGTISEKEF
ncbi:MAG: hypothetical protein KIT80_13215 [Chitinophagaceae bacterium]|nr:hypothetical protein [Chitinophagaceae bacterium]MCW5927867.1 hypothetical protein [Chitinophagaceae bacterium]